jgi:hypothetical protein
MLIERTLGVKSTTGSAGLEAAKVPVPSKPYLASPSVSGKPKVAPLLKSKDTLISAERVIVSRMYLCDERRENLLRLMSC